MKLHLMDQLSQSFLSLFLKRKQWLLPACCCILFSGSSSCYSVRILVKDAPAMPVGPLMAQKGYWRDKEMHFIDTTVRIGALNNEVMYLAACPEGLHTVEYRVTLGHVLLSGITLGKVRKIKVKYACVKPQND